MSLRIGLSDNALGISILQEFQRGLNLNPTSVSFRSAAISTGPFGPDAGSLIYSNSSAFQDRTSYTTTDDITVKVDVSRIVKSENGSPGDTATSSATAVAHLRLVTTFDPTSGHSNQEIVDPVRFSETAALSDAELTKIEAEIKDGHGEFSGAVSIEDHRTVIAVTYATHLVSDAAHRGKLHDVHDVTTRSVVTSDYSDRAAVALDFDASKNSPETATAATFDLLAQYTSKAYLAANLSGVQDPYGDRIG